MEERVEVLGANSFSGQDFVDLLLDEPNRHVLGISRSEERSGTFLRYRQRTRPELDRYRYHALDLNTDLDTVFALLDDFRPTSIVNFAAQSEVAPSWVRPEDWIQTNVVSLSQLISGLCDRDYLERFVQISSPEVYGTCEGEVKEDAPLVPSTPYAASKAAADLLIATYVKQYGFPALTVRATNVYGARQQLHKIIPRTFLAIRDGHQIALHGGGKAVKSYIHIRDVSHGELAVLARGQVGHTYHLSPEEGISIRSLVARIADLEGVSFSRLAVETEERPGQDAAYVIDSSKAREELRWTPEIGFDEGLEEVRDWIEEHWSILSALPREYVHQK